MSRFCKPPPDPPSGLSPDEAARWIQSVMERRAASRHYAALHREAILACKRAIYAANRDKLRKQSCEYKRRRRAMMTPEERERHLVIERERYRKARSQMTPEAKALKLKQNAVRKHNALLAQSPEERERRLAIRRERDRARKQRETPEQREKTRVQKMEYHRERRRQERANLTPEQRENNLALERERYMAMTPEKRNRKMEKQKELRRKKRLQKDQLQPASYNSLAGVDAEFLAWQEQVLREAEDRKKLRDHRNRINV